MCVLTGAPHEVSVGGVNQLESKQEAWDEFRTSSSSVTEPLQAAGLWTGSIFGRWAFLDTSQNCVTSQEKETF